MERIPFGIRRLDRLMGGGAPVGSVVLCAGEAGAGARSFVQTTAIMTALGQTDAETHDLYYGDLPDGARLPEAIHYLTVTSSREQVSWEIERLVESEIHDAFEAITVHDFASRYFQPSPIPRDWYGEAATSIAELSSGDREGLLAGVGQLLSEHAPGSLVIVDSLSDLVGAPGDTVAWNEVIVMMRALTRAALEWGALVLVHVGRDTLEPTDLGRLIDAATGTLAFSWESAGNERERTMIVRSFRGVLSEIEAEDIVRFETEITDAGFGVSDVRKIR
ncbi:MAG: RAD55 family ATPase [Halococcoides sp.]